MAASAPPPDTIVARADGPECSARLGIYRVAPMASQDFLTSNSG